MAIDVSYSLRNNTGSDIYLSDDGLGFVLSASETREVSGFIEVDNLNLSSQLFGYLTTPEGSPDITLFVDGEEIKVDNLSSILINRENFSDMIGSSMGEPTGFENTVRDDTTISFDDSTLTFTISPTGSSFVVWVNNNRFEKTEEIVTITDTEGLWFIYYDVSSELLVSQSVWDLSLHAPTALLYWDADNNESLYLSDERHKCTMGWSVHQYLHTTRGTAYVSGLDLTPTDLNGSGDDNSSARVTLSDGLVRDEDIDINITHADIPSNMFEQQLRIVDAVDGDYASIPIYYKSGTTPVWRKLDATEYPVHLPSGGSFAAWNEDQGGGTGWVISESDIINDNVVYWIFATTNVEEPIVAVMGEGEYPTTYDASQNSFIADLLLQDFPFLEYKLIYRLVYFTDVALTNDVKSILRVVTSYKEILNSMLAGELVPTKDPVFGSYWQVFESLGISITTSTTFQTKIDVSTEEMPSGTYRIGISYMWNHDNNTSDFEAQLLVDGSDGVGTYSSEGYYFHKQEPKDNGGSGVPGTGSSQRYNANHVFYITWVDSNLRDFELQWRTDTSGVESSIWNAKIEIWRVSE